MKAFLAPILTLVCIPSSALPQSTGPRIYYDAEMVPHIFAASPEQAAYALGYHHMRDFPIGTLDMLWRFTGNFAEFVGQDGIAIDKRVRLHEFPALVQRHRTALENAPTGSRRKRVHRMLLAYAAGVEQGRRFWRGNEQAPARPSESGPLETLIGPNGEMYIDPLPGYLSQGFATYSEPLPPNCPPPAPGKAHIERIIDRYFGNSCNGDPFVRPITIDNVLALGVAANAGPGVFWAGLYDPAEFSPIPNPPDDTEGNGSNGWIASKAATSGGGGPLVHYDPHFGFNKSMNLREYIVQIDGWNQGGGFDRYKVAGITIPGFPCVIFGYSDAVSWLLTATVPLTVSTNQWTATVDADMEFQVQRDQPLPPVTAAVESDCDTLTVFDPVTGTESTELYWRHYVHVPQQFGLNLPNDRYPIVSPSGATVPECPAPPGLLPFAPGTDIVFEQSAYATQQFSAWEYWLGMGFADNNAANDPSGRGVTSVLNEDSIFLFGNGDNTLYADAQGNLRYQYLAKVPIQGSAVVDPTVTLPGGHANYYWQGFYTPTQLPTIGPELVECDEVWINNNCTPDLIEVGCNGVGDRLDAADLESFEMLLPQALGPATCSTSIPPTLTVDNARQVRAAQLLRDPANRPLTVADNPPPPAVDAKRFAVDTRDNWMHAMWPLFLVARDHYGASLSPAAHDLVDWIETYKDWTEAGTFSSAQRFSAHRYSIVTVYTVLLRGYYEKEFVDATCPKDFTLGHFAFPEHPIFTHPSLFTHPGFLGNREAMRLALEEVATLWSLRASATEGLRNYDVETSLVANNDFPGTADPEGANLYFANPWGAAGFSTPNPLAPVEKESRWGRFNLMCVTPHGIAPPPFIPLVTVPRFQAFLWSSMYPDKIAELPCNVPPVHKFKTVSNLNPQAFSDPFPAVYPVGGNTGSLFVNLAKTPDVDSLYAWDALDSDVKFFLERKDQGSQVLWTVHLVPGNVQGWYLQALGATEITKGLPWQNRFGPSKNFADTTWKPVLTVESQVDLVKTKKIQLTYPPPPCP